MLNSFYPETSKRSLEEMAAYFGETVLIETDLDTEHKHGGRVEKADAEHSERAV